MKRTKLTQDNSDNRTTIHLCETEGATKGDYVIVDEELIQLGNMHLDYSKMVWVPLLEDSLWNRITFFLHPPKDWKKILMGGSYEPTVYYTNCKRNVKP